MLKCGLSAQESANIKETVIGESKLVASQKPTPSSNCTSFTRATPITKKPEPRSQGPFPSKDAQGSLEPVAPVKAKIMTPVLRNTINTVRNRSGTESVESCLWYFSDKGVGALHLPRNHGSAKKTPSYSHRLRRGPRRFLRRKRMATSKQIAEDIYGLGYSTTAEA